MVLESESTIYAFIGVIFSAIVFAVIAVALSAIGIPALTAPFVLTTWVFLLPMAGFRALERVSVTECASTKSLARLCTSDSTRAE
jgi:urea transporter